VGLTPDGDIWWEGIGYDCPPGTINWKNKVHDPASGEACAHPNGRFTAPASQCPVIDPSWEDPAGVPISAFLFGGRRSNTVPLIYEAMSWNHGVFMGSTGGSEGTAAAIGQQAGVRRDPFAMLPFCGYNMGDYFGHWVKIGTTAGAKLPKIFYVNWFQKDENGKFMWPGYGENSRVLSYIFDRCDNKGEAVDTAIGKVPAPSAINIDGLADVDEALMEKLLSVNVEQWKAEVPEIEKHYASFGSHTPAELNAELDALKNRLGM
jgi:phosphoenolpyruvate carboxykinase (GTP)